jgi:hypothetical protein
MRLEIADGLSLPGEVDLEFRIRAGPTAPGWSGAATA